MCCFHWDPGLPILCVFGNSATTVLALGPTTKLVGFRLFAVNEALIDLEDRFGVTTPLSDPIEKITARVYDQLALLQAFDETIAVGELQEQVELSEDRFSTMLDDLEQKGNIERANDSVRKIDSKP